MATILIPLPRSGFDPTETAIPWRILNDAGHRVVFATPDGTRAQADPRMLNGHGLGPLAPLLMADRHGRSAYQLLQKEPGFRRPLSYRVIHVDDYDALLLPGGHAPGMKPYLESTLLQDATAEFFAREKPVGAICHGVLLAARARTGSGRPVLLGRRTTALPAHMELLAWTLTRAWLGDYYRTYRQTVEAEVRAALADDEDFIRGPLSLRRDGPDHPTLGFTVTDGHYLSARWPGDAHRFGSEFATMCAAPPRI